MRARAVPALVSLGILIAACEAEEPSQIVVSVDAAEMVRTRAEGLRLRVTPEGQGEAFEQTLARDAFSWPARTTVVPREGDADRTYVVEASALDARGNVVATVRAISGFVRGETRELVLFLDAACVGAPMCEADETCDDGRCVSARVDASRLPPFGAMDGGAAASDGGVPRDATTGESDGGTDACTPIASYADEDGDGYGDPTTLETTCSLEEGRVTRAGDCDDACEGCRPDGAERCDGELDEDCDGTADEGCVCSPGATRACPGGNDVGACVPGTQTCDEGAWGACSDRIDPLPETCDNVDEDCDGRVDEGLTRGCESECGTGVETCRAGRWAGCTARAPRAETCNASDDDCDGSVDEGVLATFHRDADADGYGSPTLTQLACRMPSGYVADGRDCDDSCRTCRPGGTEVCDGTRDEDCDGTVDESCTCTTGAVRACPDGVDTGACIAGMQRCESGTWGSCVGQVEPIAETCNAMDDDCDARVDERVERDCGPETEVGICQRGTQLCSAGSWGTCRGSVSAGTETCNAMDDDCDGSTDEGVRTRFYADGDDDGYGVMSSTVEACTRPSGFAAMAGDCDDARSDVRPGATEVCDGIDQDCDARVDDGVTCGSDAGVPRDAGTRDAGVPDDASATMLDSGPPIDASFIDATFADASSLRDANTGDALAMMVPADAN